MKTCLWAVEGHAAEWRECAVCQACFLSRLSAVRKGGGRYCSSRCLGYAGATKRGFSVWAREEDELLSKLFSAEVLDVEIAALMGVAAQTVLQHKRRLGLCRPVVWPAWSKTEDGLLQELADIFGNQEIGAFLGRTKSAVYERLRKLGVVRSASFYLERGMPFQAYPPELQEVIRLHNKVRRKLDEKEDHRRPARSSVRTA